MHQNFDAVCIKTLMHESKSLRATRDRVRVCVCVRERERETYW